MEKAKIPYSGNYQADKQLNILLIKFLIFNLIWLFLDQAINFECIELFCFIILFKLEHLIMMWTFDKLLTKFKQTAVKLEKS